MTVLKGNTIIKDVSSSGDYVTADGSCRMTSARSRVLGVVSW